jgi:hypothetical protein
MNSSFKISYFPLTEVIIFTITFLSSTIAYHFFGLSHWALVAIIALSYFIIMARATTINLSDDTLRITSFNPLLASHAINIKSIIKITSIQTQEHQTDVDFGGSFFLFTRRYELEYLDHKEKKRKAYFSILNRTKEEKILKTLRAMSQSG